MKSNRILITVKAFSFESKPNLHSVVVYDDEEIKVWDDVANCYRSCHSISESDKELILTHFFDR